MAIRFQCPSCRQPIEIDDAWAVKPVACPYCRKTVMAPAESTLEVGTVPVASPFSTQATFDTQRFGPPGGAGPQPRSSLPIWALVLAIFAIVLQILPLFLFPETLKEMQQPDAAQRMTEQLQKGQLSPGTIGMVVSGLGSLLAWLAGTICGVVALRYRSQRATTFIALAISAGLLVMFCAGTVTKFG